MSNEEIDYKLTAEQLRSGQPLFGKEGALAPMLERILNAALEGEMDAHLSDESCESGNRHNGKMSKTVQTQYGEVRVDTPRDRDGSFSPQTVRKRETILAEGMADQIIGIYAFGTSMRDISRYFERKFNTRLSAETISAITDRVLPEIREWKTCSLGLLYHLPAQCHPLQGQGRKRSCRHPCRLQCAWRWQGWAQGTAGYVRCQERGC